MGALVATKRGNEGIVKVQSAKTVPSSRSKLIRMTSPAAKLSLPSEMKGGFFTLQIGDGLVAQLEERLNGIEEVVSSNLIGSTNQ